MTGTLKRKITSGLLVIVTIGIVSMLIVYAGLVNLQRMVEVLGDIEAPKVAAAHEMEINLWGQGMAVLHYLHRSDPQERERVAKDEADFERFYAQYVRLANTNRARALVRRLREDYDRFRGLGGSMMVKRDRQDELFVAAMSNFERIDQIIDREVQVDRLQPGAVRRLEMLLDLQTNVAELGLWVANYRRGGPSVERSDAARNMEKLEKALVTLKRGVHPDQPRAFRRLERPFEEVIRGLAEVEAIEAELQADSRTFSALRKKMDDLLDDEIQAEAVRDLAALRQADDRATRSIIFVATLLMPAFLFAAAVVGVVLIRSISEPVQRLVAGTGVVRQGDFSHRISPTGAGELSDLVQEFNRMVAELEGTTVSKTSLETSESRLRELNAELRRQIADRERAEEEGARLQAALRRSEMLSALGSIVAAVSHEVRNPLFAISSTVDALEARLKGGRSEAPYARHVQVLRAELDRLGMLMHDLLDYGKPASLDIAESSVADAVKASVDACKSVAASGCVTIVTEIEPALDGWPMDRARIEQVLRNLLENAIQHSPGGTVTLSAQRALRDGVPHLHMQVRDEGPGFDPGQLPHVFEPFFTRRRGGTGLGLSIVERIVDAHGGIVRAANCPGGGAAITVDLPRSA